MPEARSGSGSLQRWEVEVERRRHGSGPLDRRELKVRLRSQGAGAEDPSMTWLWRGVC